MEYSIEENGILAVASEKGAELLHVIVNQTERLWQNETGGWDGHAPVLFPFCGSCDMVLDGVSYGKGFHGFASQKEFTCIRNTASSMTFRLTDDADTGIRYPFRFTLDITYSVDRSRTLSILWEITNETNRNMPFACGGHESFALPGTVENFKLVFPKEERFVFHVHDGEGRLSGETDDRGAGKELTLSSKDLANGNTVILKDLRSRSVRLTGREDDLPVAESLFPGFSNLLIWHPDGANMICIEPWMNLPDYAGGCPDFAKKRGVRSLAPGKVFRLLRKIRYL